MDAVTQKLRQSIDDRQSQSQSLGAVAFRIAQLVKFAENLVLLVLRYSDAGVNHVDMDPTIARPAIHRDLALVGIPDRIADQVAQDGFEQHGGAMYNDILADGAPPQFLRPRLGRVHRLQTFKQCLYREFLEIGLHDARVEL